MVIDSIRNSRDDPFSDCRSFGSNCRPRSQSRKISIGVMVDDSGKKRPKTTMGDEYAGPAAEKVTSSNVNSIDEGNNGEGVKDAMMGIQLKTIAQETSPWVSPRSFHKKTTTSEVVNYTRLTTNTPDASCTCNGVAGLRADPATYSAQFFANKRSTVQSGNDKQKTLDRASHRREGGKDGTKERVEKISFATGQEIFAPENEVLEDKTNSTGNKREALRIKLWEILGPVSLPKEHVSPAPDVGVPNSNLEQNIDNKAQTVVKPRQNRVTVEYDSEGPDHTIKKPVTRSLSRKRPPSKAKINEIRNVLSSTYMTKYPLKNTFSFEEGFSGKLDGAVTVGGLKSSVKKREGSFREAQGICFPAKENPDEIEQAAGMSKTTKGAEKTSSLAYRTGTFHIFPPENGSECIKLENVNQKKDSLKLPVMKTTSQPGNSSNSSFPVHREQQEDFTNPYLNNIDEPHFDLRSPPFQIRTSTESFSPDFPPKTNHGEQNDHSHACSRFNSFFASKPGCHTAGAGRKSSDDAVEVEHSPLMKSEPITEEKDADMPFKSSSDESDSKSSKEGSGKESLSPEIYTLGKPKVAARPNKRLRSQEDINFNGVSPVSASPKGTEESNGYRESSDQNQEDGLTNAITLFSLALERVKSKIRSVTSKKSAEVLTSIAEGIYLQLQNAESQIQVDVGKLTNLSKSKRKCLETEFKEQQEQLVVIYQKFKEEVNRHLQECRSTLEGLEAQDIEFRGILEKHNTLRQKLLKQVEEAIETQLNDAQRRTVAVHKLAREKMLQLKYVLAEVLKEGILG